VFYNKYLLKALAWFDFFPQPALTWMRPIQAGGGCHGRRALPGSGSCSVVEAQPAASPGFQRAIGSGVTAGVTLGCSWFGEELAPWLRVFRGRKV